VQAESSEMLGQVHHGKPLDTPTALLHPSAVHLLPFLCWLAETTEKDFQKDKTNRQGG